MVYFIKLLALIIIGYLLKRAKLVTTKTAAETLITLVFYIFLPATLFYSLIQLKLNPDLLLLTLTGFTVAIGTYIYAIITTRYLKLENKLKGTCIISCCTLNQGLYTYPFFMLYLGELGLIHIAFFDLGQLPVLYGFAYYTACIYGTTNSPRNFHAIIKRFIVFPPLWAITLGVTFSFLQPKALITPPILEFVKFLHNCTPPLIMLTLGIFIEPRIPKRNLLPMGNIMVARFIISPLIAVVTAIILGFDTLKFATVVIGSAVPPALLTLIYAVETQLDPEFSATTISICICIAFVLTSSLFTLLL